MEYQVKDFSGLIGMNGFSEALLKNHFALYEGYVKNTNKVTETLAKMLDSDKAGTIEFAELKRRQGWEFDGMRLHELYFENLGGNGAFNPTGALAKLLTEHFGSFEAWKEDFLATASMRGIGWAVLYRDNRTGHLNNFWIDEHHIGHPVDRTPLLVIDAWEHAYMLHYGLRRAEYLETCFGNINWAVVEGRL